MTGAHNPLPSGDPEPGPDAPSRKAVRRALLSVALLALGAGLVWVWQSRPEPPPPSDPWPAALEKIGTIVRDTGPPLERAADAARAAAEPMAFLDRTRPLLALIDRWRTIPIRSRSSRSRLFDTLGVPDNAYDAVLAALDLVVPGTATGLGQLESVARRAVNGREALLAVAAELDVARQALRSFEQTPTRESAEALASYRSRFKDRTHPVARDLSVWHKEISLMAKGVGSIRNAVRSAAKTRIGSLVETELAMLESPLAEIAVPLRQYERHQADVIRALSETSVRLGDITAIVAGAHAAEARRPKRGLFK